MRKLFLLLGAVLTLGVAAACGNGAATRSPTLPVTTLGPTLAPIETPMSTESPMTSGEPSGSPAASATP